MEEVGGAEADDKAGLRNGATTVESVVEVTLAAG